MSKTIVFLLSHTPNPRIMKRARLLEKSNQKASLIYAKRTQNINFIFDDSVFKNSNEILYNNESMKKRLFSLICFFRKAVRELKKLKPDTIHLTNLDMLLCAYFYKKLYDKNVKLIYEIADIPDAIIQNSNSLKSKFIKRVEKILCKNIKYLILTAEAYWTEYYSDFVDEEKYNFIPNKPERLYFEKLEEVKFDKNNIRIGFIGYVRYKKELKKLIDVVGENSNFKFLVAGDGSDAVEIREYAKGNERIKFSGAYDYANDISKLYQSVDIIYSAYDNENINCQLAIPNRLYEAIVCKKPIIVSKGTKLSEYVEDGELGVSIDPMSEESILCGINQVVSDYHKYVANMENLDEKKWFDDYVETIINLYN